jgi:hypothetical protein
MKRVLGAIIALCFAASAAFGQGVTTSAISGVVNDSSGKPVAGATAEPLRSAIFLVDTSASRALGFEAELRLVAGVIARIATDAPDAKVLVAGFDQSVVPIHSGRAADFDASFVEKTMARGALRSPLKTENYLFVPTVK